MASLERESAEDVAGRLVRRAAFGVNGGASEGVVAVVLDPVVEEVVAVVDPVRSACLDAALPE